MAKKAKVFHNFTLRTTATEKQKLVERLEEKKLDNESRYDTITRLITQEEKGR
jgi:hypothetical protein